MKYLKTFELYNSTPTHLGNQVEYEVDDIVVCSNEKIEGLKPYRHNPLINGDRYRVLKIYSLPEDKFLKNPYLRVDVKNLKSDEVSRGWESVRFKQEFEFDADKYNL